MYISQSVNRDAAGIREDGDDGWAGDLINSNVAMLSQVYLGVLVYNVDANKQGRCVRAPNRQSGIPKLLGITKIMELRKQNVSIFGGIKVVWPENSQEDYILHPSLYNSINALHLSLQLLQGTKLEDDFLSHSTDFLSRGSLYPRLPAQWQSSPAGGDENYRLFWQDGQSQTKDDRWQTVKKMEDVLDEPASVGDSGVSRDLWGVVACKQEISLLNSFYFNDRGRLKEGQHYYWPIFSIEKSQGTHSSLHA